ncbi:MAG: transcription antitermination factor NusB, partial [Bacteroidetes bacterium]|nr:transcription antitermination factor NusB [Bacteroidota bacterium]
EKYVVKVYNEYVASSAYNAYMTAEKVSLKQHQDHLLSLFHDVIAPNDELYGFLEDECLSWADDFPVINTFIYKKLSTLSLSEKNTFDVIEQLVSDDDREFASALLAKIALNFDAYSKEIEGKTPNWDQDRITDVDKILLIMGIGELLDFESIPPKVTLNEYLEIAKEYSTPKSSLFINGILDQLSKEFTESMRMKKAGRGLL